MEKYDLIVVGSGPGGQRAAIQAAKFGKRAALVEKLEVIGGTAINTGTIPSKTIREAVLHLSGYQYQSIYGVNYRVKEQITMADLSFRALNVIKTEIDVIRAQLSRNGIEVVTGTARHRYCHGNETRCLSPGPFQRHDHHQQRSNSEDAGDSQGHDRCGRWSHRRRVCVHVRHAGRARDAD